jgi:hypothetical protein
MLQLGGIYAPMDCELNEMVSKIFRTGAAIYTPVVVARSIVTNRPNCEFRIPLRRLAETACEDVAPNFG